MKSPSKDQLEKRTYFVKYENNNSKRWDGKTVVIDGDWLQNVCGNNTEIWCGDKIKFPWTAKKGKVQYWNAVVVDNTDAQSKTNNTSTAKSLPKSKQLRKKKKGMYKCYNLHTSVNITCIPTCTVFMITCTLLITMAVQTYL